MNTFENPIYDISLTNKDPVLLYKDFSWWEKLSDEKFLFFIKKAYNEI